MGFNLGDIVCKTDAGGLKGIQREIGCECWFTSQGKTMPKIIKVVDTEGVYHVIREIEIMYTEEKNYSGIATVEHVCKIQFHERSEVVKLIFNKETCKWILLTLD